MLTIFIRTVIIYLCLIVSMRLMGKRQLGELDVSDFVTTLLISEIASLPITNRDIPLSHALLPLVTLMSLEILLSVALLRWPFLKKCLSSRPAVLIRHGEVNRMAMRKARISSEELFSRLRQKSVTDPSVVDYAILEPNGQLSVVLKASARQPTTEELHLNPPETGLMHLIISDGIINPHNLASAGKTPQWLETTLRENGLTRQEVFLLMADDAGQIRIVKKFPRKAPPSPPKGSR